MGSHEIRVAPKSRRDVPKSAERYDREGDRCNMMSPEMRKAGSASANDEIENNVGTEHKVISDVCADTGWMILLSTLKIPASPLLHNGSHKGARQIQHEAETRTAFTSALAS